MKRRKDPQQVVSSGHERRDEDVADALRGEKNRWAVGTSVQLLLSSVVALASLYEWSQTPEGGKIPPLTEHGTREGGVNSASQYAANTGNEHTMTLALRLYVLMLTLGLLCSLYIKSNITIAKALSAIAKAIITHLTTSLLLHFIAILLGAPITNKAIKTLLWSTIASSLSSIPTSYALHLDATPSRTQPFWTTYVFPLYVREIASRRNFPLLICATATIVGSWIGAIPAPLDWDTGWQIWPVASIYCAVLGYSIVSIISITIVLFFTLN